MKALHSTYLKLILLCLFVYGCEKETEDRFYAPPYSYDDPKNEEFTVNSNYILKNEVPFKIKGVVYVPAYPGTLPWEIETTPSLNLPSNLRSSIDQDLRDIKNMGANTVRFWGAPRYCYESLKALGGLHILQTIWLDGERPDFQDPSYKQQSKAYIKSIVDRIHSVYPNEDPPVIAYLVGNELSEASIRSTNQAHPGLHRYRGRYIKTDSTLSASEAFLAEMADYLKVYEYDTYGRLSLVSYSNDIRTFDLIDTPFLDFRSHNAYSYAVPYYRPQTSPGYTSGTLFQGWVEEVKDKYPGKPLLITETGLSVSPNANRVGPPNYGYGGNSETQQKDGLIQNLNDIETSIRPIAGVVIHEYLDAWWKFSLEDSYTQDPNDIEEWFGLVKFDSLNNWYQTLPRPAYDSIRTKWSQ